MSDLVISTLQLDQETTAKAALSSAVKALKTAPDVKAVVNHEYKLGTQHLLNNKLPPLDIDEEFEIKWDNK